MVKQLRFKTQGLQNQNSGQKCEFSLREIEKLKGKAFFKRPSGSRV